MKYRSQHKILLISRRPIDTFLISFIQNRFEILILLLMLVLKLFRLGRAWIWTMLLIMKYICRWYLETVEFCRRVQWLMVKDM